jgi:hypothetical protein
MFKLFALASVGLGFALMGAMPALQTMMIHVDQFRALGAALGN